MNDFSKKMLTVLFMLSLMLTVSSADADKAIAEMDGAKLPGPQLITNAWMFIASYKADPETLKSMLPEGLEPNPDGTVVINMYTVPDGNETSGFGALRD